MNNIIGKKIIKLSEDRRIDADGEPYTAIVGDYQGNKVEVNVSRFGYHARANGDRRTAKPNMDEGGLLSWFFSQFGRR